MATSIHVVPHDDEWAVRREGEEVLSTHPTQTAAEEEGRRLAREERAELQIHGREGQIRERNSYGNDPRSSPG